jgi:hypothetical protein
VKNIRYIAILLLAAAAATLAQVPDSANPYVRKPKSAAVGVELGGNSLASLVGIKGTFFVTPQFLVDAGLGLSALGLRPGVQARYLFSKAKFSPFAYGGFKYGLGSGGETIKLKDEEADEEYGVKVDGSPFVDFGFGLDYLAHSGFNFTTGIGWSQLLGGKNYEWVGAEPSHDFDKTTELVFGSGLALYLSLGYAF